MYWVLQFEPNTPHLFYLQNSKTFLMVIAYKTLLPKTASHTPVKTVFFAFPASMTCIHDGN